MILLKDLLAEIEGGGTARHNKEPAPGIVWLYDTNRIIGRVLDYGAGHGRNFNFLRSKGLPVYAYDLYNGYNTDGYQGVSSHMPKDKFDVGFTCFVINVLTPQSEELVLKKVDSLCSKSFHVVRNDGGELFRMIKKALLRKDALVVKSFEESGGNPDNYTDDDIKKLVVYGTETSRGFQRIPELEKYGYSLIKTTTGYKIYTK